VSRLRLRDALKGDAFLEPDAGVRFATESLSELKRARRYKATGPLAAWLESFGPDDVLFDVGANTGTVSLLAARMHGPTLPIVAFEPAADTFEALVRNVRANGFAVGIIPLQLALFDRTGIEPLHRASIGAGSALHAVGEATDYTRRPFVPVSVEHVLAFRIDDLLRVCGVPRPTRMKIDVDGFENKVLEGAVDLLSSGRCELYTELVAADAGDRHPQAVMEFLAGFGYRQVEVHDHHEPGTYPRIFDVLFAKS
jgi:FkbM family methyltransferase